MKQETITLIAELVRDANPERQTNNLNRRIHKWFEEFGELEQAYLSVTSSNNHRGMSWADIREEAADVLIVTIDIALTDVIERNENPLDGIHAISYPTTIEYDDITIDLVTSLLRFVKAYRTGDRVVTFFGYETVSYAFRLVELVFDGDDVAMEAEIRRKLLKWQNNRLTKKVVTDAE